jgi:predicted ATP-grasp superfamily ATP-dependent carboligase
MHRSAGRPRVLVADEGVSHTGLAAVRALAADGWPVDVAGPLAVRSPLQVSRHVSRWYDVEPAGSGADAFVDGVRAALTDGGHAVVFGTGDPEVLALSAHRDRLPATVPYPVDGTVRRLLDKLELTTLAEGCGFAVPRTIAAEDWSPAAASGAWVVKPRRHDPAAGRVGGGAYTTVATSPSDVDALLRRMRATGSEPVVQERLQGGLGALVLLVDDAGDVVTVVQQRAERVHPAGAGNTVRGVIVPVDADLLDHARALVAATGWHGLLQLELLTPADGVPRLIDANARFYGSLGLAVAAGVNLPSAWATLAVGGDPRPVPAAELGVRWSALGLDVRRALAADGGRGRETLGAVRAAVGAAHAVWRRDDPRPLLRQAGALVRRASGRR